MKKILLVLAGLMCSVAGVFAKADVTMKSGSLAELKGVKEKIYVVWDYSHATLEGKEVQAFLKEKGAEWQRDYQKELQTAEENFAERFNDKSKDAKITAEKRDAKYRFVVEVKDFHYGSTGVSVVFGMGAGDAHMSGLVKVYAANDKQPFAVIDVDGVAGAGYGNEKRRVETYRELAEQIVKLIKKAKK